ncbi:recombinase family protein [Agarivorans sp. 1_MG-2023]|uniref:recombinase family protein n=1 Tax=Agarivorans sp. 1_MG-2023 TaxID=3062634 RepID=UPI0026E21EBE|nr:recombinase family protein [Agarivorans sp. 1_MG-2023]MDO6763411.1 recombinase family protein [Agarivorans sp. 1_MG-2023]
MIAYTYIRFSTAIQASGDSLRRQSELAQQYCQQHQLQLSNDTFEDLGISAYDNSNTQEDAALGRFLNGVQEGTISTPCYLLVESLDRLSRSQTQFSMTQLLTLINLDVTVVTLMDNCIYQTPVDTTQLIISLTIMERAYNESKTKSERIKAAWQNKWANPETTKKTKNCPFWLKPNEDSKSYAVLEEHAATVRRIFELYIDGFGIYKIVRHLNENNIPSGRTKWGTTAVNRILKSKAVLGVFEPHFREGKKRVSTNTFIENYFPSIIDEQTYYLAQSKAQERATAFSGVGKKSDFPNLVNGLATCHKCGSSMRYDNKGATLKYLTCTGFKSKACDNTPLRFEMIEAFVTERYLQPMYVLKWQQYVNQPKRAKNLEAIQANITQQQTAYSELLQLTTDFSDPTLQRELKRRSEAINELEAQLEKAKAENVATQSSDVHMNFDTACQLVTDCLQKTWGNGFYKPKPLAGDELFKARVKLNRALKDVFTQFEVLHDKTTKTATIITNDYTYTADSKAFESNNEAWFVQ